MEGFLKALGLDNKPQYKEKIPDTLTGDCFSVHNTFEHGFSSQPLSLGYDSVQQLLAIGAEKGSLLILGKPGLERHLHHPTTAAVTHIQFITNKGLLVTGCDNNTLYLWSLREKQPTVVHSIELISEKATALSYAFGSDWLYVGTDAGNVHLLHLHTFKMSGFNIHWNNAVELSCRHKPGDVISVIEHPLDQGKVLIAFSGGKCVLYDMKESGSHDHQAHKRFNYDPGSDHILTSVSWLGSGKSFACSYSDGTVAIWNSKSELKPEKVFPLHESGASAFKPIYKIQQVHTDSEPWLLASGGYPEGNDLAPRTLTLLRGNKTHPKMISTKTTILDFLCLPSSPYTSDCQRPFALVILTKEELVLHDLEQPELPQYPSYQFPYALDLHQPPVTALHYTANCCDEFIASLHSVKSKLVKTKTPAKPWPIKGGKWGQEVPHTSTDLIVTGHVDGSIRLWYCSSVILQPFFKLSTSEYFKMHYQPAPAKATPPKRPPPPKATTPTAAMMSNSPLCPPVSRQTSCPEPHQLSPSPVAIITIIEDEATPTAAGEADNIDGPSNALTVERIRVNDKRKSIFKKKKHSSAENSPHNSRGPSPIPSDDTEVVKEKKKKISLKKSFKNVAKAVKIGRSMSKPKGSTDYADGADLQSSGGSQEKVEEKDEGSKEREEASTCSETVPLQPIPNRVPPTIQETPAESNAQAAEPLSGSPQKATHTSCSADDEFFPISSVDVCTVGLWMCVANKGGAVMAFNFQLTEREQTPKAIDINFDWDSVKRQYVPLSARPPSTTPPPPVGSWGFTDKPLDARVGFQLCQVALCCAHVQRKNAMKRDPKIRVPAKVSVMLYSVDLGLLVIGSNRGFALVDINSNTCLHTLSSLTSILYLSDPSKFTRALRKESENTLPQIKPLVRRHTTKGALSVKPVTHTRSVPTLSPTGERPDNNNSMTVSDLECSVTALELVQLQLDKQAAPALVLWVGLASGHLVAYGVNTASRKIDLVPTKFIQETKSPIVSVVFLNEWGDRQVIPFQRRRTNLSGSPEDGPLPRTNGEHYAIVVSEDKLRSYLLPGCQKIESTSPPLIQDSALLQSDYFTCNDLPCLLSVSSNKDLFVHNLPGLRQLLHVPFSPLSLTRSLCTFHVSGQGQAIFMSSNSELQRLSLVAEDKLNLPGCLPDLYVALSDPEPHHGGVGKRILDALFTSGPATIDREQLFGEAARRPVGNLYKLDGRVATSYAGKKDRDKEERMRQEGCVAGGVARQGAQGQATGVAGQLNKNVLALNERKQKLSAIEERTEQVAHEASNFADLATKLRQKYE